jgi:cardiolipin synthase (CMP-forming)
MDTRVLRYIPNAITVLRLILVLPIAFCIIEKNYIAALWLFAVSGFSDGLDGFIARRYGWVSAFGRLIDPLADKLMMITTTLTLGLLGHFPLMLMVLIIVKDLTILSGVFPYTTLAGFPKIQPNFLGKCTTAAQIFLLFSVLLNLGFPGTLSELFFDVSFWIVAIMTSFDGAIYLWVWTLRLVDDPRWKEST